jgi:hypothetical protein
MQTTAAWKSSSLAVLLSFSTLLMLSGHLRAQSQNNPKPGPEQKKLEVWVGEWNHDVQTKATPLGPAEKFSGTITYGFVLNEFYLEGKWSEKHADGITKGEEWHWYDPATKTHNVNAYGDDGFVTVGNEAVNGTTWTSISRQTDAKGQVSKVRTSGTMSPDAKSFVGTWDLSMDDGKTWVSWWEIKLTKVRR